MGEVNWDLLEKELEGEVLAFMGNLVDGAEEDLKKFGAAIGKDMVRAIKENRLELRKELIEQTKVLGEIHRIRLNNATWDMITKLTFRLAKVARVALLAGGVVA